MEHKTGQGSTLFVNSSPTAYYDQQQRAGAFGKKWRRLISSRLSQLQINPTARIVQIDGREHGIEVLRYETKDAREIWALVENPTRQASVDDVGSKLVFGTKARHIRIETPNELSFKDLRTQKPVGPELHLPPGEAIVLEVKR